MNTLDTDYLVIGSGTAGLAFVDTLIERSDAHVTLVDRRGQPGGHWTDAYPFVALHQPSAFYGVNSLPLGSGRKDTNGPNAGLYELATGPEINAYFDRVVKDRLLPSGRVRYLPMHHHLGDGCIENLLSGERTQVRARRRLVDAHYGGPSIAATHTPRFAVDPGVRLVPPNALPGLWHTAPSAAGQGGRPRHVVVLGAGKTALDALVWLLNAGASPEHLQWVAPRDAWLIDRLTTQPGAEFFDQAIGGQARQMQAFAEATSLDDLFLRLEAAGQLLRIDRSRLPTMFHLATVSQGEVALLRRVTNVVRRGRVQRLAVDHLQLQHGRVDVPADTLFVDCTASAVEPRPVQPIFQDGRIVLQLVRLPLPSFSAAMTAFVETHCDNDADRNRLCATVPFPHRMADYPRSMMASLRNQMAWGQDKAVRQWLRDSRLDGFAKLIAGIDPQDTDKLATLARLRESTGAAMANYPRLMAAIDGQP